MHKEEEEEAGAGETRGRGEMVVVVVVLLLLEVDAIEAEGERRGGGTFVVRSEGEVLEEMGEGGVGVREPDNPPRRRRSTVVAGTT